MPESRGLGDVYKRQVQACAPTSDYDDNKIEEFYDQLQNVIDQTPIQESNTTCIDDSIASPQTDSETTLADAGEEYQQEQTRTDSTRK